MGRTLKFGHKIQGRKTNEAPARTERLKNRRERRAEQKKVKKNEKALRRWEAKHPTPKTAPKSAQQIQRPDKSRIEALRRENANLAKKIALLKQQLTALGVQAA